MLPVAAALSFPFAVMGAQRVWTLDGVLRQLDREAGDFRSLTADLERTKVTVVVNGSLHRIWPDFGAARWQDAD